MKKIVFASAIIAVAASLVARAQTTAPADYVNPMVGTLRGNTHPGAVLPWGMASVSPYNVYDYKAGVGLRSVNALSPYISGRGVITGFSHVNFSSLGCADGGIIQLMPLSGDLAALRLDSASYGSPYNAEEAKPGYYKAVLERYNVKAEMSATARTGISKYTYAAGKAHVLLNLGLGLSPRQGAVVRTLGPQEIEGYRLIGGCGGGNNIRAVYFVVRFSKAASQWRAYANRDLYPGYMANLPGDNVGALYTWDVKDGESIQAKVGISFVSIANARLNLQTEQPEFAFEAVARAARETWNAELGKLQAESRSKDDNTRFYTALYHSLLHPNVWQDVNGQYLSYGSDSVRTAIGYTRYTNFSLWSTYRTIHPLLSLVYPERAQDMAKSLLAMSEESGWLPRNEVMGHETYAYVGDPSTIMLTDTWMKGIKGFDSTAAYQAMRKSAITEEDENPLRPGLNHYIKAGFVPQDNKPKVPASAAATLEYNLADYNLSRMAATLGKKEDIKLFQTRSLSYKALLDPKQKFIRPKNTSGSWFEPFDNLKLQSPEGNPGFVKGFTWHYTFVPLSYDTKGLLEAMGGDQKVLVSKLQKCFNFGIYSLAASSALSYPYLFNHFADEEWRTQREVRGAVKKYFLNKPDGLPSGDDAAASSAWCVFSMMGLYPELAGSPTYQLTSPTLDKVTIKLNAAFYKGTEFVIEAHNNGIDNVFTQSLMLNDKPSKSFSIEHSALTAGGKATFELARTKKKTS
jgi:predicted alpha-1,2-mannosidase